MLERGSRQRWAMYPPFDPYGDGYVAHLRVELLDEGLRAETVATIDGYPTGGVGDLGHFLGQLADDWRGWPDRRVWHALEHEMTVDAEHDGRGYVTLGVTLRRHRQAFAGDAWSARAVFTLEAGEEMTILATGIQNLLSRRDND